MSRDSVRKHCNFRDKNELNFPLLSDGEEKVVNLYGVLKEKSMYGRKYMGIERSTFIIDEEGNLVKEYRKVKAASHVDDLLKDLRDDIKKAVKSEWFHSLFDVRHRMASCLPLWQRIVPAGPFGSCVATFSPLKRGTMDAGKWAHWLRRGCYHCTIICCGHSLDPLPGRGS